MMKNQPEQSPSWRNIVSMNLWLWIISPWYKLQQKETSTVTQGSRMGDGNQPSRVYHKQRSPSHCHHHWWSMPRHRCILISWSAAEWKSSLTLKARSCSTFQAITQQAPLCCHTIDFFFRGRQAFDTTKVVKWQNNTDLSGKRPPWVPTRETREIPQCGAIKGTSLCDVLTCEIWRTTQALRAETPLLLPAQP